jgi:hypothetical protein
MQNTVMRRVRTVHAFRPLFSASGVSVVVFVAALWGVGREVWVARVFQNEPSLTNISAIAHFYLLAFLDTRLIVQILSVLVIAAFISFVRNTAQTISVGFQYA